MNIWIPVAAIAGAAATEALHAAPGADYTPVWVALIVAVGAIITPIATAVVTRISTQKVVKSVEQKVDEVDSKVGTMKTEIDGRLTEYRRLVEAKAVVDVAAALVQGRTEGVREERMRKTNAAEDVLETARIAAKDVLAAAKTDVVPSPADIAADGIIQLDETGTILYCNAAVSLLTGFATQDLIGKSIEQLIPKRYIEQHRKSFGEYVTKGEKHVDWSRVDVDMLTADGKEIPITISFGERILNGQRHFVGVIRKR